VRGRCCEPCARQFEPVECGRLERRQLQHALDERNRALHAEVHLKQHEARQTREAVSGRKASRAFTGSFVRQQNAMIRQLQLGDLRRRREEEHARTAQQADRARKDVEAFKVSAAGEARRRAQMLREGSRQEKMEMMRRREAVDATRERELDMVRLKQAQLREIRSMLSQPVDLATGLPASMMAQGMEAGEGARGTERGALQGGGSG